MLPTTPLTVFVFFQQSEGQRVENSISAPFFFQLSGYFKISWAEKVSSFHFLERKVDNQLQTKISEFEIYN